MKYPEKFKQLFPDFFSLKINTNDILTEETLINEVRNVNKLIPLEVELSETVTVDNTYFNLDIFKKVKKITFYSNCSYSIDFSTISDSDIILNKETNEININIPTPQIYAIDIDESRTEYENTELGILRFGEVTLSSDDLKIVYDKLYDSFYSKMNNPDFYRQALTNTKISLEGLIHNLTSEEYTINLNLES